MAKVIKYKFLSCEINHGTEEKPDMEQIFLDKKMPWSEANEAIARLESKDGKYTVEDDGLPEPETSISTEERLSAVETKFAAMEAAYGEGVAEA